MKNKIKAYKAKLEDEIAEYMAAPVSERYANAVRGMVECWEVLTEMEDCICTTGELSKKDAEAWLHAMENSDGTKGAHWTEQQTTQFMDVAGVSRSSIPDYVWCVAMNMMYSDYLPCAQKMNVNKPEFYATLAKDFLFDKDGGSPEAKIAAYYASIVKPEMEGEK